MDWMGLLAAMTEPMPNDTSVWSPEQYPRVLIVYLSCINKVDQHGVSLRNWFADWPKDHLAQIYSGNERGTERFCGYNFKLGPAERRLGSLFFRLKGSALGDSSRPLVLDQPADDALEMPSRTARLRRGVSEALLNSGLWELVFRPRLSARLLDWIDSFRPQVVYCQGYNLTFAWLPVMIKEHYGLPVCFQTGDDWPSSLYADSIVAWAVRPVVERAANSLVQTASVRFANGPAMALEYQRRYDVPFEPLMMSDDIDRFRRAVPQRTVDAGTVSIVYAGGLAHGRWASIVDLCTAAKELGQEGIRIAITAFASFVPPQAAHGLQDMTNLQIMPAPAHEEVPCFLKGADILFLPETLDPVEAREIRLSISTKAHLYMMSERPILIYGSSIAGVVDYAKNAGWGYVVDRRDIAELKAALKELITNGVLGQEQVRRGTEIAFRNHDQKVVRRRFRDALKAIASRDRSD